MKSLLTKPEALRLMRECGTADQGLASILAHELRTPLTSIIGFAELLLNDPAMDQNRRNEYLRYIHDEGVRLNGLVATIVSEVLVAERNPVPR